MKQFTCRVILGIIFQLVVFNYGYSQCTNTTSFGSAAASTTNGTTVQITTLQYQTEYSTVSGLTAGSAYQAINGCGGYVTVHSGTFNGPVVAMGNAPLSFTATVNGTYFLHWNTNAACGTATNSCTTSIRTVTYVAPPAPANDNCAGAVSLTTGAGCSTVAGTTFGATQSLAGCLGTANDDVWYSFVASGAGQTITLNPSASFDGVVQVFSGSCASLSSVNCNDASYTTGTNGSNNLTGLTAGQTYFVRVYDYGSGTPATSTFSICAQNYTPPVPNNQDCLGAIPVCASTYSNPTSYSGTGNYPDEIESGLSCLAGEINDVWYQFTVQTAGQLCFIIDPNTNGNDYDWAVYNLSTSNCSDIYNNAALEIACDFDPRTTYTGAGPAWATSTNGNTGMLPAGSYNAANTQVEDCPTVTAGQTFVLNVSNFSSSAAGYTLYFPPPATAGMATIFDNIAPSINSLTSTPACGATSFSFNMSENVLCSTVQAADFTLAGPGGPYTVNSITGSACAAGGASENTFTIATTPAITTSGTYSLCLVGTVTDLCGNVAAPGCFNFTIAGPTVAVTPTNPNCSTGTGSVTGVGSGGSGGPRTYSLNGGAFQASGTFTGLAAGAYTLTTQDGGGCRGQNTFTITIPTPVAGTVTATPTGCAGTGSIDLTPSGGTPGYTYSWAPSGGTGQDPTGLAAGNYTVTITDSRGCTATRTATVTAGGSITATFTNSANQCINGNSFTFTNTGTGTTHAWTFPSGTPASSTATSPAGVTWAAAGTYTITHTATTGTCTATNTVQISVYPRPNGPALTPTQPTCIANGSIAVTAATGGTPAYQYNLNGGANSVLTNYTNQPAGTYTVNVTDANGCTNNSTVTLTVPPSPTAIATTIGTAHCGQSDGTITLGAVTGGNAAYTYSVTPTVGFSGTTAYTGQATGTHTIIVRDANSCTYTTTVNVPNAAGPTGPNATSVNSTCGAANGTVTLAPPTTGTGAFTYSFNGSGFTTTTNYTGLAANTYTYVVRDVFGCPLNGTVTVNNSAGPTAVVLTPVNASCGAANGSFTIGAVTGGGGTNTYSVSPGPAGFNATTNFTALAAGTYTVTVRDVNGCTFVANTTINNSGGPTAVVLTPVNTSCGGSTGTLTIGAVTGGTGAMTYSVAPGPAGFNATTSFTALAANTYTVTVRDVNGCTFISTAVVGNNPGPTAVALTPVNATCGLSNGSFTIGAVTGGGGTNTYSVSPGPAGFNATTNFTGLAPNTYTVTVRDVNGCTFVATTVIGNTAGPTAVVLTPVNSTCGNANGSFTIGAVTGGTGAMTYSVAPGPAGFTGTTNYTSLAAGTFTVTVRDANACTYTTTTVIGNTAGPTAVTLTPVNTSCGGTTGTLTIGAVTGGTSAYTYSVSPGPAGFNATTSFTNLGAATYTVVVQDANGCQTTGTSVVGNNPAPTAVVLTPVNASCGATNGSFTIGAVTSGTAGFTYSVNGSAFTGTTSYTGLAAGTYTVVVQDANGCQFTSNTTINNSGGPTAVVLTPVNSNCGAANGSFTIGAVTGGTGAIVYSVNGSPFTATTSYTGLTAGTYTVVVRDANNCTFSSTTVVGDNPGPTAVVLTPVDATCGLSNGSFTIGAVTGGGGTNVYSVNGSAFTATTSYTGLAPNTYTVIVRDVNGCTFTSTTVIGNTAGPTAVVLTPVNSTCGNANGSFTIGAVTGGTGAMTYSVAPGAAGFTGTTSYTGLAAGTYTVTVRDVNNCTFVATTVVGNTAGPTAVTLTPVNTSCGGTTGTLTIGAVTGGTSAYTYSVSPGPAGFNATTSFTNLGAATYTVIVQDANGCQFTQTSVVGNNPAPTAVVLTPANATCGASNGSFTIGAVTGGTAGFTYSVNGSAFTGTTSYTGLAAATYTVVVQDANACTFTSNVTVNNSGGPTAVVLTPVDAACGGNNGSFTIGAVTGGAGGNMYSVNGSAFTATTSYINLAAGTYTVVVRDANNCTFTTTTVISNSGGPTAQVVTSTNSACSSNTGTVTFGATTGGTGIMTYSFDGSAFTGTTLYTNVAAGTYNAIVRDGNGCQFATTVTVGTVAGPTAMVLTPANSTCGNANGSFTIGAVTGGGGTNVFSVNGGAFTGTTNYTGLTAGTYTVVVRDVNGCTFTDNVTVTNTPGPTAFLVSSTSSTCGNANGTATAGAVTTSGSTVYQYSINGGVLQAGTNFTGLAAATYTLLVQDANGCQLSSTVVVTNLAGPTAQVLTPTNATCGNPNGSVLIGATTGGNGLITYNFNGGAFSGTTNYTNLAAGTYTVIAQDANGCQFTQTTVVSDLAGPTAIATTPTSATCGGANGSVAIGAVTGGSGTNTYSFNGSPFTATTSYTGLIAGTYTVVVQDVNLCQFTQTVSVINSGGPSAAVVTPTNSTCGNANGTIAIGAVTGGSGAITYSLNGGAFSATNSYTGLIAGTYTVAVRDVNGCTFTQTVDVLDTPGPTAVVLTPTNSTCGSANGSFAVGAVTGGTSGYTYSVNASAFTATINYTGLLAGTYTVIVRDANSCQFSQTVVVGNTAGPTAVVLTPVSSTCGNNNGQINVGAVTTTGSTIFQYSIDGGALGASTSFTGLSATTHTILVQDANGCQLSSTVVVTNLAGPTAQVLTPTNATCGNPTGSVLIGATTGGNGLITYNFNGGAFSGTTNYTNLAAGTYTVIAQDANGCQFTQTTVVSDLAGPTSVVVTPTSATCGGANGSVVIGAVTGGSGTNTFSFNGSPFTATTSYPGLSAATYTVVVQDVNLCQFTQTVTVNNSGGPSAVVVTPTNSTCGNPNGSIAIGAVTGGAGTINYSLNGGALSTTTSYTGLAAGTYTVLVSDVNACTFSQTVTVNNTAGPTAVVLTPTSSTCGSANGVLAIGAVTDGTAGYTYSVNASAFTGTTNYTGLLAGTYTVVVQDANSCQFTQTVVLGNIAGPTAVVLTPVNSTCGNNNGQINVGAVTTTGSTTFQYSIDGGALGAIINFSGLSATTHTILVQDANGCQLSTPVNVTDTPGPTAQAATTVNSTCGNANGVINIGATTGGTSAYQFAVDGGALSAATSYTVAPGTHTVTVSDANACTFTVTTVVNNTAGPSAVALTSVGSNCGNANGSVTVGAVTDGTAIYQYAINGGAQQVGTLFPNLLPATYTVTVTDANSCVITNTVTVVNLGSPTALVSAQTNVSCNGGNNGGATITGSGGAGAFTYTLNSGQTNGTGVFTGLIAASYTATVTDAAGCLTTATFTITQPAVLAGSIQTQTSVSCFAGTNGSVTVTETGGTAPFTYSLNGGAFGATPTFGGLAATAYTVTVRDNLGCTSNVPVTIVQPTAVVLAFTSVNANCTDNNGTATVIPSGGTPGYTQAWTGGGGSAATTVPVIAGTYSVTVTDANGCSATGNTTIGVTPGGTATMTNVTNVTCNAAANGSMTVSMGGGAVAPFSYVWTPNVGSTATVTGLAPGTYSVTVTDDHGCIATTNASITEPLALTVGFTSTNVSCNGGSDGTINSNVAGGTAPYTYAWSPGAFNTAVVSGLPVGTYTLTATDANGCIVTGTRSLTQPTALTMTPVISDPHCNQADGSATVTGSGGAGGYTFSMNGGAFGAGSFTNLAATTYTITIQDANLCQTNLPLTLVDQAGPTATITASSNVNCNGGNNGSATVTAVGGTTPYDYLWSAGSQTTQTATNMIAGVYGVVVTDANGCNAAASIIITQPSVLLINATGTDPVCNGQSTGTGTASAFGGTTPYAFQWAVLPIQNTAAATLLPAGSHNVTVTDANGCVATTSINLVNPPLLTVAITKTDVACNSVCDGTATAVTNNGTNPFAFVWSDANAQTTQTATGLCAGTYTLNITDFKGCTASATTVITEPTVLTTAIINPLDVTCSGVCDGSGTVTAGGGTPPYAYSWTNSVTTPVNNNICAGSYTATVTDDHGCISSSVLTVNTPNPLVLTATSTDETCFNACNGTATASFSGGTAPYDFVWQPSLSPTFDATALCVGTHTVTITDANGCSQMATTVVGGPTQLIVSTVVNGNNICGQNNGSAQVQVSGGTSPFTYLWSNGATTGFISNLVSGPYNVTVTDGNNCPASAPALIIDIPGPTITITNPIDISCFGLNDGSAVVNVAGGTLPYGTQTWLLPVVQTPNPDQTGNALWPGVNVYQVVDANGCLSLDTVSIFEPTQLVSLINGTNHVTCNPGVNNGNSTMLVNGGTAPYSYQWTDVSAQTVPTATSLAAGTYTCNVTDANGCATSQSVTINQPLPFVIITNSAINVDCFGSGNGSISISPTGGTPAYTYSWSPNAADFGPVVTNLAPASYLVTVTDANGCTANAGYNITQPSDFTVNISTMPSRCSQPNGSISLGVTGATPGYNYVWNTPVPQTTPTASNLSAPGLYSCVITDANGCVHNVSSQVNDIPPPTIDSLVVTDVTCFGLQDGTAIVYPKNGGNGAFTYSWTQGSTSVGQTQLVNGLGVGTYNVVVTETFNNPAGSCQVVGTATIVQPLQLFLATSTSQTVCNGQTIGVSGTGGNGTPGYTYNWTGTGATAFTTGGNHNLTFTNNTSSTIFEPYTVSINDANNCGPIQKTFTITVLPKITAIAPAVTGCLGDDVTLNASAVGGDGAPYTYTWGTTPVYTETGATSSTVVPVISSLPTVYNISVDDGCSTPENITVTVSSNPKPSASLIGVNTEGCADLTVTFSGSGGSGFPGCTYDWDFGDGNTGSDSAMTHTYTSAGLQTDIYNVQLTVTTPLGCVDIATQPNYVTVYPNPVAEFTFDPLNTTEFDPVINFYNQSLLGDTYSWNFGELTSTTNTSVEENPMHVYLNPGTYDVNLIVTTDKGCTADVTHPIFIEPEFAIYVPNAFTPNEDTKNEVFIPQGIGISNEKYHMYIYNRWGELIFESNDLNKGWDGTVNGKENIVQEDVYVWKILAYDLKNNKHNLTGHVTVVK